MILLIKLCLIIICFVCLERIVEILLDSDYYFEQKIANYFLENGKLIYSLESK